MVSMPAKNPLKTIGNVKPRRERTKPKIMVEVTTGRLVVLQRMARKAKLASVEALLTSWAEEKVSAYVWR